MTRLGLELQTADSTMAEAVAGGSCCTGLPSPGLLATMLEAGSKRNSTSFK